MRIDSRLVGPGIFLVIVGAIPLAVQQGLVGREAVAGLWRLWPLFLVFAGLGLVLRATPARELGGILSALLGGAIVGSLLAVGITGGIGPYACSGEGGRPFPAESGTVGSPPTTTVVVTMTCGSATVGTTPGNVWTLTGTSPDGTVPETDSSETRLTFRSSAAPTGIGDLPRGTRMAVTLPEAIGALRLTVDAGSLDATAGAGLRELRGTVNAGALVADLARSPDLARIELTVNAGAGSVLLPDSDLRGSLTVNAGAIEICVPDGVGLRLTTKGFTLGSYEYADAGLTESDHVWTSPGWESAPHLIDLETTANAGSIALNPEEGCR